MVQKKFRKAKEHTDKVVALETEIMECWALRGCQRCGLSISPTH